MARKLYCQYCGCLLEERCNCEKEAAMEYVELVEKLENRPDTQLGWRQQDMIDIWRSER